MIILNSCFRDVAAVFVDRPGGFCKSTLKQGLPSFDLVFARFVDCLFRGSCIARYALEFFKWVHEKIRQERKLRKAVLNLRQARKEMMAL